MDKLEIWLADPKNWIAIFISTLIAVVSLSIAVINLRRKSGILVHGAYQITSSAETKDSFVSGVILENLKDRAVTIYDIYLKVGVNLYLEVARFESGPLILKAYETYSAKYDTILFHMTNGKVITLGDLLSNKKIKKRIVLSTSNGKYIVPRPTKRWSPMREYFRNDFMGLIQPVTTTHNKKSVGLNIKYIVDFVGDEKESVFIAFDAYSYKIFAKFRITKESLESEQSLMTFLEEMRSQGLIHEAASIKVTNVEKIIADRYGKQIDNAIQAEVCGFFFYYIVGRISNYASRRNIRKSNMAKRKRT